MLLYVYVMPPLALEWKRLRCCGTAGHETLVLGLSALVLQLQVVLACPWLLPHACFPALACCCHQAGQQLQCCWCQHV
jgi:hypothetical protein